MLVQPGSWGLDNFAVTQLKGMKRGNGTALDLLLSALEENDCQRWSQVAVRLAKRFRAEVVMDAVRWIGANVPCAYAGDNIDAPGVAVALEASDHLPEVSALGYDAERDKRRLSPADILRRNWVAIRYLASGEPARFDDIFTRVPIRQDRGVIGSCLRRSFMVGQGTSLGGVDLPELRQLLVEHGLDLEVHAQPSFAECVRLGMGEPRLTAATPKAAAPTPNLTVARSDDEQLTVRIAEAVRAALRRQEEELAARHAVELARVREETELAVRGEFENVAAAARAEEARRLYEQVLLEQAERAQAEVDRSIEEARRAEIEAEEARRNAEGNRAWEVAEAAAFAALHTEEVRREAEAQARREAELLARLAAGQARMEAELDAIRREVEGIGRRSSHTPVSEPGSTLPIVGASAREAIAYRALVNLCDLLAPRHAWAKEGILSDKLVNLVAARVFFNFRSPIVGISKMGMKGMVKNIAPPRKPGIWAIQRVDIRLPVGITGIVDIPRDELLSIIAEALGDDEAQACAVAS